MNAGNVRKGDAMESREISMEILQFVSDFWSKSSLHRIPRWVDEQEIQSMTFRRCDPSVWNEIKSRAYSCSKPWYLICLSSNKPSNAIPLIFRSLYMALLSPFSPPIRSPSARSTTSNLPHPPKHKLLNFSKIAILVKSPTSQHSKSLCPPNLPTLLC